MRWVALSAALLVWAQQTPVRDAAPQSLPTGTSVISGVVVSADASKSPMRRASVSLTDASQVTRVVVTGDDGRFTFGNLPAGRYTASADKPGYVPANYGASKYGRPGTAIALAAGQAVADVSIPLTRGGVITGTIADEHGAPARDVRIMALTVMTSATGERTLAPARLIQVTTDDRGMFRLYGLAPADYVVVATPSGQGIFGAREVSEADYQRLIQNVRAGVTASPAGAGPTPDSRPARSGAPIFFPGTSDPSLAQPIHIGAAEERAGADFVVKPMPTMKLSGTVVGVDGQPAAGISIQVFPAVRVPLVTFSGTAPPSDRDGKFVFNNVAPGTYAVLARPGGAGRAGGATAPSVLWAQAEVTIGNADADIALRLQAGVSVSGTVTFDGHGVTPPDGARVRVLLRPVVSGNSIQIGVPEIPLNAAGEFSFAGVVPGRYRLEITVPGRGATGGTWVLKSVTAGGRDAMDTPMEVGAGGVSDLVAVVTDRPTELTGRIQDANGQPAPDYFLLLFPKDPARWTAQSSRIQQTRPGRDGVFAIRGVLPGEYLFATVTDLDFVEMYNPAFLQQLIATAVPVTLADGEKKVLNLQVK